MSTPMFLVFLGVLITVLAGNVWCAWVISNAGLKMDLRHEFCSCGRPTISDAEHHAKNCKWRQKYA